MPSFAVERFQHRIPKMLLKCGRNAKTARNFTFFTKKSCCVDGALLNYIFFLLFGFELKPISTFNAKLNKASLLIIGLSARGDLEIK